MSGETEFELTEQDNVHAVRSHTGRLFGWFGWAILAIALAFIAIDIYAGVPILTDFGLWMTVGLGLFFFAWDRLIRDTIVRRQFRQSKMRSPLRVRWDDQTLWIDTQRSQARYEWAQFFRWMASKTTLLLYRDAGFFIHIPRRALSDEAFNDMIAALKSSGVRKR